LLVVQDIKGYRSYDEQKHPKDILDALDIFIAHITGKDHQKKAMDGDFDDLFSTLKDSVGWWSKIQGDIDEPSAWGAVAGRWC